MKGPAPALAPRRGARAILIATHVGLLGLLGAFVVLVGHHNKQSAGLHNTHSVPTRYLSQRVVTDTARGRGLSMRRRQVVVAPTQDLKLPSVPLHKPTEPKDAPFPAPAATTTTTPTTYTKEAEADEITSLPGLDEKLSFRHFSGYLPITPTKNIFYWYVEAAENADTAPLVWWTNGGPGCSGLFGFMNENGPFRPTADGEGVHLNPYSWNQVANMIFVEQPVTVGFSFTTSDKDKKFGDEQAAEDNYKVIQTFLERYPHLRSRDLHLTAESYGGHYLPQLAKYIVDKNEATTAAKEDTNTHINLKGFMVGNPLTDPVENLIGAIDSFWGHSLVPHELYDDWNNHCRNQTNNLDVLFSDTCMSLQNDMWGAVRGLNPYALDYPVCEDTHGFETKKPREGAFPPPSPAFLAQGRTQRYHLLAQTLLSPLIIGGGKDQSLSPPTWSKTGIHNTYEPCEDAFAAAYLNRKDVQEAIHARLEHGEKWGDCSDTVFYNFNHEDRHAFMQPVYTELLAKDPSMRILIFSGDDDSVCATQGTQMWIRNMNWGVAQGQDWMPWGVGGQVAGYLKGFTNGVSFATVHGAGHEVPAYKPEAALALFAAYLDDNIWASANQQ